MTKLTHVVRVVLGLALVFFGLNGFFHFFTPPAPTGNAAIVTAGLDAYWTLFPTMFGFMTLSGALLLVGRFVPLALAFMTPILVNIVGYHVSVDPGGIGVGAVLTVLVVFLAWAYRDAFKTMLAAKHAPWAQPAMRLEPELPLIKRPTAAGSIVPPAPPRPSPPAVHVQ